MRLAIVVEDEWGGAHPEGIPIGAVITVAMVTGDDVFEITLSNDSTFDVCTLRG